MECNSQPLLASSKPLSVIRRHPKGRSVSGWISKSSSNSLNSKESSQAPRSPHPSSHVIKFGHPKIKNGEGCGLRGPGLSSKEFEEFRKLSRHAPTLRVAADLIASRSPPGRARNVQAMATRSQTKNKRSQQQQKQTQENTTYDKADKHPSEEY